ncbi:putative Lipopolysaccharide kinase (Kdo/WaaP) family protein [Nitrosotalea devaniterrae]|uniref:non-specific serine/threonine protein kinase n=1 Tax=Nitrosotalea devaniterrae TaxID=1078905 RepID=A0A128A105_9ARCH|nr:putative Lipopolysaccharide kinase (Kdo/WaaP) family protein [Candidatus Nitrosotalea devanaterra]
MKLVKKGAEADIYVTTWNGQNSILKIRKKKDYRVNSLDIRIRTLRTIREAKMIYEVKSFGISTPIVYFVDEKKCEIYLQFIKGKLVRDLPMKQIVKICTDIGKIVGTLHKNGIMHGDLTTSNFILSQRGLVILDFGLSQKTDAIDDYAIDLRLFKEVLNSAHAQIVVGAWASFIQGYQSILGNTLTERIVNQVLVIEKRGRYANVV